LYKKVSAENPVVKKEDYSNVNPIFGFTPRDEDPEDENLVKDFNIVIKKSSSNLSRLVRGIKLNNNVCNDKSLNENYINFRSY